MAGTHVRVSLGASRPVNTLTIGIGIHINTNITRLLRVALGPRSGGRGAPHMLRQNAILVINRRASARGHRMGRGAGSRGETAAMNAPRGIHGTGATQRFVAAAAKGDTGLTADRARLATREGKASAESARPAKRGLGASTVRETVMLRRRAVRRSGETGRVGQGRLLASESAPHRAWLVRAALASSTRRRHFSDAGGEFGRARPTPQLKLPTMRGTNVRERRLIATGRDRNC